MIYSVSCVQQNDSVMYICMQTVCVYIDILFQILFHYSYYKILNIIPCAIESVLVGYLF